MAPPLMEFDPEIAYSAHVQLAAALITLQIQVQLAPTKADEARCFAIVLEAASHVSLTLANLRESMGISEVMQA
jgi:hypothetical protein